MIEQKYDRKVIGRYKQINSKLIVDVTCVKNTRQSGEGYVYHGNGGWTVGKFVDYWQPFDNEEVWEKIEEPLESISERIARLKKELEEAERQLQEESFEKEREAWVAVGRADNGRLYWLGVAATKNELIVCQNHPNIVGLHKITLKAVIEEE